MPPPFHLAYLPRQARIAITRHKRWRQMAGLLVRGLTGRGRRAYLIVATALFLLSMSLLILKSWSSPRPAPLPDVSFNSGFSQQSSHYPSDHTLPSLSLKEWEAMIQRDTQRGLAWFVQVSDIHLRRGIDAKEEVHHFRQFVDDTLSFIRPAAVLVTGDLTNSKTFGVKLSELPQEWLIYQRIVRDRVAHTNTTLWLDLPGNHDNFDEVQHAHFKAHAVQTEIGVSRVVPGGEGRPNITLIPLDASLMPGIRAFNFLGHLTRQQHHKLEEAVERGVAQGDVVLVYGHYPTSAIVSGGEERGVLAGAAAYLCGHLHTGNELINTMWTTHPSGMAEVELGDWAHRHRYRVMVVDAGQMMWVDVTHPTWPLVLLASLTRYNRTPTSLTFLLRLVVFSNEEIASVSLRVDDNLGQWTDCHHRSGPLYTARLSLTASTAPPTHAHFIKALQVLVVHSSGSKSLLRVGMAGAGFERPNPSLLASAVLSVKLHSVFLTLYLSGLAVCVMLLLLGKYVDLCEHLLPTRLLAATSSIAENNNLFSLLLVALVYPLLGPWYLGPLARECYGVVFMWGIFVDSTFLPGQLTYPDAFFLGFTLQYPGFTAVLLKKILRCGTPRPRCFCWVRVMAGVTLGAQVVAVLAWLVLDSLFLNGPIRLLLSILFVVAWRRV